MNSPDAIKMMRTKSLANVVYDELEHQILSGTLVPGDALREVSIASDLGISRGPVREAFRILEERGLAVFEKNCGVYVRRLDSEQAVQIYQVRIPLERLVGQLAARNLSPTAEIQTRGLLDRMQDAVTRRDIVTYAGLNLAFHDSLALHTGNPVLSETYRKLVTQLRIFRGHTFRYRPETIGVSLNEHIKIFEAVAGHDEVLAGELLQLHAQDSLRRLNATLIGKVAGNPTILTEKGGN